VRSQLLITGTGAGWEEIQESHVPGRPEEEGRGEEGRGEERRGEERRGEERRGKERRGKGRGFEGFTHLCTGGSPGRISCAPGRRGQERLPPPKPPWRPPLPPSVASPWCAQGMTDAAPRAGAASVMHSWG